MTKGFSWTVIQQWGTQLLSLLGFVFIARLVAPADVGLVALASVFIVFAQIFVDSGMSASLIQRQTLTRAHIDTAFWLSLATGCALAVAGVVVAPMLATLFAQPGLAPIVAVLSLSLILFGLASVQNALLRRELAQRSLAIRSIIAATGGAVVGVVLAYRGFGAWALVGQQLAYAALGVITLWRASPWRPGRQVSRSAFNDLFGFGVNVVGSNILLFFRQRTDNLLVGIYLGTTQLGIYALAYRILDAAQAMIGGIASRLAFPAFSKLQDRERLAAAFLRVDRMATSLILPTFLGLSIVSPELITVVFGNTWQEAGSVASVLFLIGWAYSVRVFSSSAFNAGGHADVAFRFQLVSTGTSVVGFFIATTVLGSLLAVASAFVISGYLLLALNLYWLRRYVGVSLRSYFRQLRGVAVATVAMACAVLAVKLVLRDQVTVPVLLGLECAVGALVFLVVLRYVDPSLIRELFEFARAVVLGRRNKRAPARDDSTPQRADFDVDLVEVASESPNTI